MFKLNTQQTVFNELINLCDKMRNTHEMLYQINQIDDIENIAETKLFKFKYFANMIERMKIFNA
jgi:hypothetical protein